MQPSDIQTDITDKYIGVNLFSSDLSNGRVLLG